MQCEMAITDLRQAGDQLNISCSDGIFTSASAEISALQNSH